MIPTYTFHEIELFIIKTKKIKSQYYFKCILNGHHYSAMAKFKCNIAPIKLETGCYEGLDVNDKVCPISMNM